MSDEITTAMIDTYNTGIELLAQQMTTKLASRVRQESKTGERVSFDQVGLVAAKKADVRHQDTQYTNTPHRRRWVLHDDWDVADLLDKKDIINILNDPGGSYTQVMLAALMRERDATIISAALGSAYTGKLGTTVTPFLAANQIAHGGTGFTLQKVRDTMKLLKASNGVEGNPDLTIAWTSAQEDEFINTTEVKSFDFNTQKVLVSGGMDGVFYGFSYVRLEDWTDEEGSVHRILPKVTTVRTCVAWVKNGLLENVPSAPMARTSEMSNKKYSWQYFAAASIGATRMQESLVVQIDVQEP